MLITSFYDIYNKPEKFNDYLSLFHDLAISGLPIILFTDPSFVDKFSNYPPTLKVFGVPLNTFELYSIGENYSGDLPKNRTKQKDTKEFLSLMNTKIEFVLRGSQIVEDETLIWLDFGILKVIKNKEEFINKLKQINTMKFNKILIPGCWQFGNPFSVDTVNWRFCGGIFIIPRQYVEDFYINSRNVLTDFCKLPQYKLTWETNVWNIVEYCKLKDIINWYSADHNDTILINIKDIPASCISL